MWGFLKFANDAAENTDDVATQLGQEFVPCLPIHAKSKTPTQGVFSPVHKRKAGDGITTARDTDFLNPAQLYPTTGPGNLAPSADSNFRGMRDATPGGNQ